MHKSILFSLMCSSAIMQAGFNFFTPDAQVVMQQESTEIPLTLQLFRIHQRLQSEGLIDPKPDEFAIEWKQVRQNLQKCSPEALEKQDKQVRATLS